MAKKELAASGENSVLRDAGEISAKAVLDAFKENDPVAVATMEKSESSWVVLLPLFAV